MTKPLPDYKKKKTRNNRGHGGHWYTRIQKKFLKDNEAVPRRLLTAMFNKRFHCNIPVMVMKSYCSRMGCLTGRTGCYPKGHIPQNKGQRGMVEPNSGQFQKGNLPQTHVPLGTEIYRSRHCIWRKIGEPNVWRQKHHLHWERYRGPVPKDKIVRFKDGNHKNICMANLELISRSLHARYNKNHLNNAPKELQPTVRALSKLQDALGMVRGKK